MSNEKKTNEMKAEVCEWIEDNTPSTGRKYLVALTLHDDVAAIQCTVSVFLFTMQSIYVVCVFHKRFNNAATHFPPRFGIATDHHQHWVAYRRRFQALADMKLKQAKGAFKAGGSHRLRQSNIPAGNCTQHAPVLQYIDHIQKKIGDLHRRETAFLDQLEKRFPKSASPNQLTLEKCGPLEDTIFMRRFRTAHIDFWAKEHPHYIQ